MQRLLGSIGATGLLFLPACATTAPTTSSATLPESSTDVELIPLAAALPQAPEAAEPAHRTLRERDSTRSENLAASLADEPHTGLRGGDWDFTLAGSGSNNDNWNAGAGAIAFSAGYMLSDSFELSVRQATSMDNAPGDVTHWNGATRAAFDLHIPLDVLYPFVGANVGRVYGGSVVDTFVCAPEAGIKWFLQSDAYLLAMAEYQMDFEHVSDLDDAWHEGVFVYTLGLGLRF